MKILPLAASALLLTACGKNAPSPGPGHLHEAVPPHQGTPVALGDDYQIELVRDAAEGRLQAYILDGEMENFVRIADSSVPIKIGAETFLLEPVANSATGEKIGDTSLFETRSDWFKTNAAFRGVVQRIDVRGTDLTNVPFTFPKQNGK